MGLKTAMKHKFIEAYASIIGEKHLENNECNQDACFFIDNGDIIVLTVADGVGSKEKSHLGSKKIGEAVFEGFKKWRNENSNYLLELMSIIITNWESYFDSPEDYSTTCLFTIIDNDIIYIGQIGDGIIFYILNNKLNILAQKEDDFINITNSISNVDVSETHIKKIRINHSDNISIFMATDGVSESLICSKQADFLEYIISEINKSGIDFRNNVIENILKDWNSIDDKTIGIIYKV